MVGGTRDQINQIAGAFTKNLKIGDKEAAEELIELRQSSKV